MGSPSIKLKHFICVVIYGTALTGSSYATQITLGQNAILNGDAESGVGSSDGSIVAVPGWTTTSSFTAVQYGAPDGFPAENDPGPADRGSNLFAGGPASEFSSGTQSFDISNLSAQIGSGLVTYTLSGYLGGFLGQDDNAVLTASFLNEHSVIGEASIGPVLAEDRGAATGLLYRSASGFLPSGTQSINITLNLTRQQGSYNDGYADNLSFVANSSATPEPGTLALFGGGLGLVLLRLRPRKAERL